MNQATTTEVVIPWATYPDMVSSLNKFMPGHGADFLHAVIGIVGETGELAMAGDRGNIIEECSDLEFYVEAGWQALERIHGPGIRLPAHSFASEQGTVLNDLMVNATILLDYAKKQWVYNQNIPLDTLSAWLAKVEARLLSYYEVIGLTRKEARDFNMRKLAIRYGSKYSDNAAQARADKAEGS